MKNFALPFSLVSVLACSFVSNAAIATTTPTTSEKSSTVKAQKHIAITPQKHLKQQKKLLPYKQAKQAQTKAHQAKQPRTANFSAPTSIAAPRQIEQLNAFKLKPRVSGWALTSDYLSGKAQAIVKTSDTGGVPTIFEAYAVEAVGGATVTITGNHAFIAGSEALSLAAGNSVYTSAINLNNSTLQFGDGTSSPNITLSATAANPGNYSLIATNGITLNNGSSVAFNSGTTTINSITPKIADTTKKLLRNQKNFKQNKQ